jgi:putative glutamine amidotransferase
MARMTKPHRPLVLITCSSATAPLAQGPRQITGGPAPAPVRREALPSDYAQAVLRAGGAPVLLPNTADDEAVAAAVSAADGLLLSGGGDVAANLYGRSPHATDGGVDDLRDTTELYAIRAAIDRGLSILAICRGIQMLNVAMDGTLIQDIPSRRAAADDRPTVHHGGQDHDIRIEPGSVLHRLWNVEGRPVNSTHHQAVDRLADGLRATAWAQDGIIEAAESTDGRRILAVQFHPEKLAARDAAMLEPFRWLVGQACT